jgi:hypothetical protein
LTIIPKIHDPARKDQGMIVVSREPVEGRGNSMSGAEPDTRLRQIDPAAQT